MIRIKCTSCARVLGIDDTFVGKPAFCPACGLVFTVPAPAVLLGGVTRPTHVEVPPMPAPKESAPRPTAEPLLPEGPIRLAGDTDDIPLLDPLRLPQTPATTSDQIHATRTVRTPSAENQERMPTPAGDASAAGDGVNWSFLSLEPEPSEEIELSIVEELAAAGMAPEPMVQEPPVPAPLPVVDAIPVEEAAPPVPEAIPVSAAEAQALLMAGPAPQDVPVASPHPVVWAEPVFETPASAPAELIEWDEEPRPGDAPPPLRKKKKTKWGPVSLIEGLEDFYLLLFALGGISLIMLITLAVSPKLFWLAIVVGGLIWMCGSFWFSLGLEDAGRFVQAAIALLPFAGIPLHFLYGPKAVLFYQVVVMGFMLILAVPYVIADRNWLLRPYIVAVVGALLVITGLAILASMYPDAPNLDLTARVQSASL